MRNWKVTVISVLYIVPLFSVFAVLFSSFYITFLLVIFPFSIFTFIIDVILVSILPRKDSH